MVFELITKISMKVEISRYQGFVDAIKRNLEESPYHEYVAKVLEILYGKTVYLWGGAVRDPIVRELYGLDFETRDFDLTVDDSEERINLRGLLKGLRGIHFSRFGTPKWKPKKGLEIDVGPFSAGTIFKRENLPINLETTLISVDVTTSAIAYGLADETIYSVKALDDMRKKEVNVLNPYGEDPSALMSRLVLHSDHLSFEIGEEGKAYISEKYSPVLDDDIRRFLEYKGVKELFPFVVKRLRLIQEETHKTDLGGSYEK
jgi:tRNA nucleotidyltransferase/poly(A) polymerase